MPGELPKSTGDSLVGERPRENWGAFNRRACEPAHGAPCRVGLINTALFERDVAVTLRLQLGDPYQVASRLRSWFLMPSGEKQATPNSQMQAVLDQYAGFNAPRVASVSPENARHLPTMADAAHAVLGQHLTSRAITPFPEPVGRIEHTLIPGPAGDLLIRAYTPEGDGPFPVLVYFHGGGWVIATLDTYDDSCRALCNMAECLVVSVAYRQAPERKFPAAVEDAYAAYQWVRQHAVELNGDAGRVALGGESAGGNLAAVVALLARDRGALPPVHQLLIYPVTNFAFDTPSYRQNAEATPLNRANMEWFWRHYLTSEADGSNPFASPLRAPDLSGLPPATVITDEIDPLYSEGQAYADRLREAGVPVEHRHYGGVTHEFFGMVAGVSEAKDAMEVAAKNLQAAFSAEPRAAGASSSRW